MSFIGNGPKVKVLNLAAQSADPINPVDGDIFNSDGTPRDAGLWTYTAGAWEQVSTGSTLSTLANLTLTPQTTDPAAPAAGMLVYFVGHATRNDGLYQYDGVGYVQLSGKRYQEFVHKDFINVYMASTANIVNPLTAIYNGVAAIDGMVPKTGELILLKNQTTASENGVYLIGATSGTTVRYAGTPVSTSPASPTAPSSTPVSYLAANTFDSLNRAQVHVCFGTANNGSVWFQTAVLTSLSDSQTWVNTTPLTFSWTAPQGVHNVTVEAIAGGGGGGGAGVFNSTPTLQTDGSSGGDTIFDTLFTLKGAPGGDLGVSASVQTAHTNRLNTDGQAIRLGGLGDSTASVPEVSILSSTAASKGTTVAYGRGGGGGASGRAIGGRGGNGPLFAQVGAQGANAVAGSGAGGGGGGGASFATGAYGNGGFGGDAASLFVTTVNVIPGTTYTITVGVGGKGGKGSNNTSLVYRGGSGGCGGSGYVKLSW
jgi:hypothetical protein